MTAIQYDAFVSYRRSDGSAAAHWLRREIQSFRAPRSLRSRFPNRLKLFMDTAYERGTSDFYDRLIRPSLLSSRHLIVIATPDAVRRPKGTTDWIAREVEDFSAGPHSANLIVVRAAGAFDGPLPASINERYPNVEIVDLRGLSRLWFLNPIKAARISAEKLKIVAPLLDLPSDEMPLLRQEEERRQQIRLGLSAGGAASVLITVSALSLIAFSSQQRAEGALGSSLFSTGRVINLIAGEIPREGATAEIHRQLISEACDLLDKLRSDARTEAPIDSVTGCYLERSLERESHKEFAEAAAELADASNYAQARFEADATSTTALAWYRVVNALADLAARRNDSALLQKAIANLATAATTISAIENLTTDVEIETALARVRIAEWQRGKNDAAAELRSLEAALAITQRILELDIGPPWLAAWHVGIAGDAADIYWRRNDFANTRRWLENVLGWQKSILAKDAKPPEYTFAVARTHYNLARVEAKLGEGTARNKHLDEATGYVRELLARNDLDRAFLAKVEELRSAISQLAASG